ncbi:MAG: YdcF family protein [Rhodospirillaceae bacterium]|nr:YdcF family protein [Rhodospirillales bacterium]
MTPPQPARPSTLLLALKAGAFLAGAGLGLALAWFCGFLYFVATLPDRVMDPASHTDAIVVLTGGSERLTTGMALLDGGLAGRLFISGVHRGVELPDILKLAHTGRPDAASSIVLGYAADDTVGNAAETAAWVGSEKVTSLRLVTGAYHMPRSLTEFRQVLPGITIVPHPVFPDAVKSREWWRWPGTAALLATEYSKYLAAITRHWFLPKKASPP